MKITKISLFNVDTRRADPEWKLALASTPKHEGLFVKLSTDEGIDGWGYMAPVWFRGDTRDGARAAIEQCFAPYLIGKSPFDIERILVDLDRVLIGNSSAKAAIEIALYDTVGKALGVPLYQLLGGLANEEISVMRIVPIKEPGAMAERSLKLVQEGYRYLKVKIAGEPAKDVQRIKEIRGAVGDSIMLTVDANQSYDPASAINTIKKMQDYGIVLVEQPVPYDDWEGLAAVTRGVDCLVEADESVGSLSDLFKLLSARAATSFNIRMPKMGGICKAKKAAAICGAANTLCRAGVSAGSRLIAAADAHVIASTPNLGFAPEAGEFTMVLDDPVEGLEVRNGILRVPTGPGLGVKVNL